MRFLRLSQFVEKEEALAGPHHLCGGVFEADTALPDEEGLRFFPFVFTLFFFILFANLIGMSPYAFTTTSHLVVTGVLALLVISIVIIYGFYKNGLKFFGLFYALEF